MKLYTIWLIALTLLMITGLGIILFFESETKSESNIYQANNSQMYLPSGQSERMIFADRFNGSTTNQLDTAIKACGDNRCFVYATPDMKEGAPSKLPDNVTLIDLRQESFRVIRNQPSIEDYNMTTQPHLTRSLDVVVEFQY